MYVTLYAQAVASSGQISLVFLRTERCSVFTHNKRYLRGILLPGMRLFWGGRTKKSTILQSGTYGQFLLCARHVHTSTETRRRTAGKAAAATQEPHLQSVLCVQLTALLAASSSSRGGFYQTCDRRRNCLCQYTAGKHAQGQQHRRSKQQRSQSTYSSESSISSHCTNVQQIRRNQFTYFSIYLFIYGRYGRRQTPIKKCNTQTIDLFGPFEN